MRSKTPSNEATGSWWGLNPVNDTWEIAVVDNDSMLDWLYATEGNQWDPHCGGLSSREPLAGRQLTERQVRPDWSQLARNARQQWRGFYHTSPAEAIAQLRGGGIQPLGLDGEQEEELWTTLVLIEALIRQAATAKPNRWVWI